MFLPWLILNFFGLPALIIHELGPADKENWETTKVKKF